MNVSNNIKFYRNMRRLKQAELGKIIGEYQTTISKWERGEKTPNASARIQLCKTLRATENKLFPNTYFDDEIQRNIELIKLRENVGLTHLGVARAIHTNEYVIDLWEMGEWRIPEKYYSPLCELYECTLQELLNAEVGERSDTETVGAEAETAVTKIPRRSRNEEYTDEEKQFACDNGMTQGRKGVEMPRINMAFYPDVHEYITIYSQVCGMSMTEFVNNVLRKSLETNRENYERAKDFRAGIM